MANSGNNTIVKFDPGGHGSLFASSGLNHPRSLAFDSSGNLYAANWNDGTIEKFDSGGTGSLFASEGTFAFPFGLVIQPVPEPATWAMVALGAAALLGSRRFRRRLSRS